MSETKRHFVAVEGFTVASGDGVVVVQMVMPALVLGAAALDSKLEGGIEVELLIKSRAQAMRLMGLVRSHAVEVWPPESTFAP